jgi:small conductance mechanosensitive channel
VAVPFWHRLVIAGAVILGSLLLAKLVDARMARRKLAPGTETRYRILRRSIMAGIVFVGALSALFAIPQVRGVAGALLASSAVIGLVIGLAAQRTLGNFMAGILIAFTQPLRIGDRVFVDGQEGTVEEIALTYTYIRADDNTRIVIPNEKLASDTIRNATIVSRETLAEITVAVPLDTDLASVVALLAEEVASERQPAAFVSEIGDRATVTVRAWAPTEREAERLEADLRLRAHERLRAHGVFA